MGARCVACCLVGGSLTVLGRVFGGLVRLFVLTTWNSLVRLSDMEIRVWAERLSDGNNC
jgi:hypothetical protein